MLFFSDSLPTNIPSKSYEKSSNVVFDPSLTPRSDYRESDPDGALKAAVLRIHLRHYALDAKSSSLMHRQHHAANESMQHNMHYCRYLVLTVFGVKQFFGRALPSRTHPTLPERLPWLPSAFCLLPGRVPSPPLQFPI